MLSRCLLVACLALAACATPAERARYMEAEMARRMAEYGPACERLGYVRGENPWRDCVLRLSDQMEPRYNRFYPNSTHCIGGLGAYDCINY